MTPRAWQRPFLVISLALVAATASSQTAVDDVLAEDMATGEAASTDPADEELGGAGFLPEGVERIPTVDEILAGDPDDASYRLGKPRNCVQMRAIRRIESLDRHRVLFVGRTGRVWLNEYKRSCDGPVLPSHRARTTSRGATSMLCRDDNLAWFDTFNSAFAMRIQCRLGEFQEITVEQADALKVALEHQRKTERERRRQKRREK